MEAKILNLMEKGKKTLARIEVDNGTDKVVVPVILEENMEESDVLLQAKTKAEKKFANLNKPQVIITPENIDDIISEARQKITDLKIDLESKINQKIVLN